jgi:hypothetical protein
LQILFGFAGRKNVCLLAPQGRRVLRGTPLKAADFAFLVQRLLNLHDTPVYLLDGVSGVDAPDDYTFVLTSKDPNRPSRYRGLDSGSRWGG